MKRILIVGHGDEKHIARLIELERLAEELALVHTKSKEEVYDQLLTLCMDRPDPDEIRQNMELMRLELTPPPIIDEMPFSPPLTRAERRARERNIKKGKY